MRGSHRWLDAVAGHHASAGLIQRDAEGMMPFLNNPAGGNSE
jgi:hypothetical protein